MKFIFSDFLFIYNLDISRQMPGPAVAVCEGDTVIVDVKNHLQTETTSVHFHGKLSNSSLI